jgi:hypothetical protein
MLVAIFFSFSSVEFAAGFAPQGLKPLALIVSFAAVETAAYSDGVNEAAFHTKSPPLTTGCV